jgi:hypothetical protein
LKYFSNLLTREVDLIYYKAPENEVRTSKYPKHISRLFDYIGDVIVNEYGFIGGGNYNNLLDKNKTPYSDVNLMYNKYKYENRDKIDKLIAD